MELRCWSRNTSKGVKRLSLTNALAFIITIGALKVRMSARALTIVSFFAFSSSSFFSCAVQQQQQQQTNGRVSLVVDVQKKKHKKTPRSLTCLNFSVLSAAE
tara:strand:+ start:999 stop:1304 length:306 start_codon:yes stop_codon:yes gene_type:complete